jgi:hypothetical protein
MQGTEIGELLAEIDWIMKCMCLGTKTNENKTVFKSWSQSSQLKHLLASYDFPADHRSGSIVMSCDHATVQMAENEIIFPEEPKMKITDDLSPLYSQYITDMYESVGYHDEPKLLKLQELIKLILAVEWLYKEKGVRMNKKWIMYHTSQSKKDASYLDLKEPPTKMIPKPPVFKAPSSDVALYDSQLGVYKTCISEDMGERRWGYYDYESTSVIAFKADGTPCPPQKIHNNYGSTMLPEERVQFHSLTVAEFRKSLPTILHQDKTLRLAAVTEESESKLGSQPSHELAIPLLMMAIAKLFTPGMCDEADVESKEKLIADWTVPIPCVFAQGKWKPSGMGGVSTCDIPVEQKPRQAKPAHKETEWKDNCKKRGHKLVVRAEELGMSLTITLVDEPCMHYTACIDAWLEFQLMKWAGRAIVWSCTLVLIKCFPAVLIILAATLQLILFIVNLQECHR